MNERPKDDNTETLHYIGLFKLNGLLPIGFNEI